MSPDSAEEQYQTGLTLLNQLGTSLMGGFQLMHEARFQRRHTDNHQRRRFAELAATTFRALNYTFFDHELEQLLA